MGLFGKKKESENKVSKNSEEFVLKEELEKEVEDLQANFRDKQDELQEVSQKIEDVKKEYDTTVSSLMTVKKELNQKKMELDSIQRKYRETEDRIKNVEKIRDTKALEEIKKTETDLEKIKKELAEHIKKQDQIKNQVSEEQSKLHSIRKQHAEAQNELEEANSRLYNAKQELDKKDHFEDTSILSPKEKEFIQGDVSVKKESAGIIEAASVVVGSLKSKLSMKEKELETVQNLLEKEREEHEKTREKLDELKKNSE